MQINSREVDYAAGADYWVYMDVLKHFDRVFPFDWTSLQLL